MSRVRVHKLAIPPSRAADRAPRPVTLRDGVVTWTQAQSHQQGNRAPMDFVRTVWVFPRHFPPEDS
ncbi:hypothetical protein BJ999_000961 [Actinomadura citrea]|uniref:Uncharacterized protein n=1 Tax=Actinomadura citrea TaxID=46158 RepID=A0A7Y9G638_9ACTN|nr:hypothetical protein [Actinomadura citrea]GGT74788.1 hypothetical protein GCM10010177_36030 [Actinomadura citrea]